uniref:Uncharacterized protein n=1 Tax=Rhizophora mucronata TaxID=61149 RepID=A0A2P2IJZ6_RHIMU
MQASLTKWANFCYFEEN